MNEHNRMDELDEVLFAFHRACANPSADEIIAWTSRYPQFADDIRAHAAILKDWAARGNLPADEPHELMLTRARSRLSMRSTTPKSPSDRVPTRRNDRSSR